MQAHVPKPPVAEPAPVPASPRDTAPFADILALQQERRPWFINLFRTLRDLSAMKRQPPLMVTFRPLTEEELINSKDPELQQLAHFQVERTFWQSFRENLRYLFTKEPPLQTTVRPLTKEELRGSALAEFEDIEQPWYVNLARNLKELVFPPKLPPLEVTAKPVQVKELFAPDPYRGRSHFLSLLVHIGLVALAFTLGTNKQVQQAVKNTIQLVAPVEISPYMPDLPPAPKTAGGGGGGGDRSPLPASKGRLPRADLKQFTPPTAVIQNENPRLVMEPTIIADPNMPLPNVNMPNYGDPFGQIGPPSSGPGSGGGIGSGSGGGVGSGRGPGVGPGSGGGFGGGAFRIGGGVSAPVPIYKVEPEYSEEARKAKFQGTVVLAIVVDETGKVTNVRVLRPLGMGLDEKAIEAVTKWRFRPGYKDGKPVPVMANVEVNFRLL
jgi:TonB family protein